MKKILISVLTILLMSTMLIGTAMADDQQDAFLQDLSEGLAARWAYDGDTNSMTKSEMVEYYSALVLEESSRIGKYRDVEFENAKFNLFAHAYIEAIDNQTSAIKYLAEFQELYDVEWNAGYNARSVLIPLFVDLYGLVADEETVQGFRDYSIYTVTTTIETTTSEPETVAAEDYSASEEEFQVFSQEGVSVYVTGYKEEYNTKKVFFRVENLNHRNIHVATKDYQVVVNGKMVSSSLSEDVQSGKSVTATMSFYPTDSGMSGIDTITDISFILNITDDNFNSFLSSDTVYLTVNEELSQVYPRVVYSDTETIKQVQELLNAAGYDCGAVDGSQGKNTNSALLQFERDHGLPEITDITPELLEALQQAAGN